MKIWLGALFVPLISLGQTAPPGGGGSAAPPKAAPAPAVVRRVEPEYPMAARAAGLQGSVYLSFHVSPDGVVQNARVRRGLGFGLDESAVAAVRQWQYSPGTANPGEQSVEIPFRTDSTPWRVEGLVFSLDPSELPPEVTPPLTVVQPVLDRYTAPAAGACAGGAGYGSARIRIGRDGVPDHVQIQAVSDEGVRQGIADAAQSWRFQPGSLNGQPMTAFAVVLLQCGEPPADAARPGGGTYRVGGGVSAPSLIYKVEPEYSEEARRAKYQGTVLLYVVVQPSGKASDMRVVRSLGLGLDQEAILAVRQWRFKPGFKDGQAVPVAATIEVNFKLL